MTKIEELYHLMELLKKHNLPISPILEYAIKEREEQYAFDEDGLILGQKHEPKFEVYKELDDYCREFVNLSTSTVQGKKLPHKAILLLSIFSLVEKGTIRENKIELNKDISSMFSILWNKYMHDSKVPSVWTPFWHMKSESFWHFKPLESEKRIQELYKPSIGPMRAAISYAYLDKELYLYIQNAKTREQLKNVLEKTYLLHR